MEKTRDRIVKVVILVLAAVVLFCCAMVVVKLVRNTSKSSRSGEQTKQTDPEDYRTDSYIKKSYRFDGETRTLVSTREVRKDSEGRIVYTCDSEVDGDTTIVQTEYDEYGRKTMVKESELTGGEERPVCRTMFAYDGSGNGTYSEEFRPDVTTIIKKEYNQKGNLISHVETRGSQSVEFVRSESSTSVTEWDYPFWNGEEGDSAVLLKRKTFDEEGRCIKVVNYVDAVPWSGEKYSTEQSPWTEYYDYAPDGSYTHRMEDSKGRLDQVTEYDPSGMWVSSTVYSGADERSVFGVYTRERTTDSRFPGEEVCLEHYVLYYPNSGDINFEIRSNVKMIYLNDEVKEYIYYQTYEEGGRQAVVAEFIFDESGRPQRYRRCPSYNQPQILSSEQVFDEHSNITEYYLYDDDGTLEERWEYEYEYFRADD